MHQKIILKADERIVCPKCSHGFSLELGITRQAIDQHADEFEAEIESRRSELEAQLAKEAQSAATRTFAEQIAKLQDQVSSAKRGEREAQVLVEQARAEARLKAEEALAHERQALLEDLATKDKALMEFRANELDLRRRAQALEEQQRDMEVVFSRRVDEERVKLTATITQRESDRFALVEAEWKKKIEDAQRANEDLRRKLDQGSQQLQGEVLELEIEQTLTTGFFHDLIEEVKKGQRGADVIQTVRTFTGEVAGKIIWEAKRAENWSDKWLEKLKDDQQDAKADLAVLVTTAMPKGIAGPLARIGDVWVISPAVLKPMAETLRVILLEAQKLKSISTGKAEKIELLYNYLASPMFSQRMRVVMDTFASMQADLESEKRAFNKIWTKRQVQIERVTNGMGSVIGELQAISQNSLPGLNSIDDLDALTMDSGSAG